MRIPIKWFIRKYSEEKLVRQMRSNTRKRGKPHRSVTAGKVPSSAWSPEKLRGANYTSQLVQFEAEVLIFPTPAALKNWLHYPKGSTLKRVGRRKPLGVMYTGAGREHRKTMTV